MCLVERVINYINSLFCDQSCTRSKLEERKRTSPAKHSVVGEGRADWSKKSEKQIMESGNLRRLLGKEDVKASTGKSGNYNKRAIPFELDNEGHVAGLNAICEAFADPWNTGRAYSRGDLATDVGDFFVSVQAGQIVPIPKALYDSAVAPFLAEQAKAAKAAKKTDAKPKKAK